MIETLPYGCVTWSPNKPDSDRALRATASPPLHASPVPRLADPLANTDSENIDATVRRMIFCTTTTWNTSAVSSINLRAVHGIRGTRGGGPSAADGDH